VTIKWLRKAEKDLDDLFAFVAQDSLDAAEKEVARVFAEVSRLQAHPSSGRPGRVPETRELVVPPYIIAYRVKTNIVQILRVLHSSRQWPKHL